MEDTMLELIKEQDSDRKRLIKRECALLDQAQADVQAEYHVGGLSPAQKLTALAEVRKIVYLRCLINGLIAPKEIAE